MSTATAFERQSAMVMSETVAMSRAASIDVYGQRLMSTASTVDPKLL